MMALSLPSAGAAASAFSTMWSTAGSAIVSLSATTTMPFERSEGGRLKTAIGMSASCAFCDDGGGALAVLRDQDDAVDALGDAVAHLLELAVGVLVGVALDDRVAGFLQRRGDRAVARHPELGLEVLEGEADRGGGGAAAGEGGAGEDGAGGEGLQSGHVVVSLSVVRVSGGFFGVADVLDGLQHRLGREDALEPVVAEDQRLRLGDGVQRAVGELALGEDAEGDGELDVEVAEDEVVRGLLAARRGGPPRRWPRAARARGWRRRSRRAPARGWRAARR